VSHFGALAPVSASALSARARSLTPLSVHPSALKTGSEAPGERSSYAKPSHAANDAGLDRPSPLEPISGWPYVRRGWLELPCCSTSALTAASSSRLSAALPVVRRVNDAQKGPPAPGTQPATRMRFDGLRAGEAVLGRPAPITTVGTRLDRAENTELERGRHQVAQGQKAVSGPFPIARGNSSATGFRGLCNTAKAPCTDSSGLAERTARPI
jgi:hypothetical protein